jgi:cysteinyl-tRNA synthetase
MLKLYNTLSRTVEDVSPLESTIRIYSCGPTVYDYVHIGNLIAFIFADNLNRALKLDGRNVKHAMNITDVDDKTIKRSQEDYPDSSPEQALKILTLFYEKIFKEDLVSIGNKIEVLDFIRATDSIELMQNLILRLINNGYAYIADDGIYFSIEAYKKDNKKYGQLLELDASDTSKARINNDEYDKHSAHDFVLWKFMRPDEPAWSFEIDGKDYLGRPGWHIECSAMSEHSLGKPFDIHTGGVDLVFPHHENEIAQSTAGESSPVYAKIFAHNEHLLIDKAKMSKSLGNIYTLRDLSERNFDPLDYRLLVLQSHYRNQANFSWELLEASKSRRVSLSNLAALAHQTKPSITTSIDFHSIMEKLKSAYLDDLNTPKALASLSEFQSITLASLVGESDKDSFKNFLVFLDDIFGLKLSETEDIDESQKKLIEDRELARENKNWASSDQTRDKLIATGIGVRDTGFGPIWYFI